jgi:hypothetical protein
MVSMSHLTLSMLLLLSIICIAKSDAIFANGAAIVSNQQVGGCTLSLVGAVGVLYPYFGVGAERRTNLFTDTINAMQYQCPGVPLQVVTATGANVDFANSIAITTVCNSGASVEIKLSGFVNGNFVNVLFE